MITALAIILYALTVAFAYATGTLAERREFTSSGFGVILTTLLFAVASALVIWG